MTRDTYTLYGVFLWSIANRYPEHESLATYSRKSNAQSHADRLNADGGSHVVREIVNTWGPDDGYSVWDQEPAK